MSLTRKAVIVFALAVIAFLVWRTFFYAPVTNPHPSGTSIIAFGDSLTAGTGASAGEDYPSQLAKLAGREVLNKGVPGETTGDALQRIESDVLKNDPRIVIVLLGGNDLLQQQARSQTFANLDNIIQRIQATGALVVLVGIKGLPFADNHGPEYKRVARERGAVFVPNVLGGIIGTRKLMSDQVHPNGEGYKIVAERIYKAIKPYL